MTKKKKDKIQRQSRIALMLQEVDRIHDDFRQLVCKPINPECKKNVLFSEKHPQGIDVIYN